MIRDAFIAPGLMFWMLVIAFGIAFGIAMSGCAPTSAYVAARQIETGAAEFVDTAADTWHAYSHARLENMKDACADLACFKTAAAQWESGTVAPADKAIVTARDAVRAYDASLNTADALKRKDFSTAIQQLFTAVEQLTAILDGYGVQLSAFKVIQ